MNDKQTILKLVEDVARLQKQVASLLPQPEEEHTDCRCPKDEHWQRDQGLMTDSQGICVYCGLET